MKWFANFFLLINIISGVYGVVYFLFSDIPFLSFLFMLVVVITVPHLFK